MYSLIFFVCYRLAACHPPQDKADAITIRWDGKRATGMFIPEQILQAVSDDSIDQLLTIRLTGEETAILGHYQRVDGAVVFEPLIPFTRGLTYAVWLKNNPLGELTIPALAPDDQPALLAIYPSQDSLPNNLLKIYLHFSRPMREGQSQKYVALLKNRVDTLPDVFLPLQPELWNADRTLLTLWFDPGRIKRDLLPNKRLGTPLQTGVHYQLVVSAAWTDEQGATLAKVSRKTFLALERDSLSPMPARWTIYPPQSGRGQPVEVAFGEALDYSLLTHTLHVLDEAGKPVSGTWQLGDEEKRGWFKPNGVWKAGQYRLRIEQRLEDLAGNNLTRPFDRDMTRKERPITIQPFTEIRFTVQ